MTRRRALWRIKKRYGNSRQSEKARLIGSIRRAKSAAVILRLKGMIAGAMRYEEEVDRYVKRAFDRGWGEAAGEAEVRGIEEGTRAFRRGHP